MKVILKKIVVILFIILFLFNSSLLSIISIALDTIDTSINDEKIKTTSEINLEKYVNYNINTNTGVLVKLDIKSGIEYDESQKYQPVKSSAIEIKVPKINGEFAQKIELAAISTKATNGSSEAKNFDYTYNNETGLLIIQVLNKENENGEIYTEEVENAKDNFKINLYYSSNCYDENNILREIYVQAIVTDTLANEDETVIKNEYEQKFKVSENISGLISADIETTELYNGYINANIQNKTNYQTEYIENLKVNLDYAQIADKIEIKLNNDFLNTANKQVETNDILYKTTVLNKNQIMDLLGSEGYLEILNSEGDVLLEINNETEAREDGSISLEYESELADILIRISNPEKIGVIDIYNKKSIKETMLDLKNNKIQTNLAYSCINNIVQQDEETKEIINESQEKVYYFENKVLKQLQNSETKIDVSVNSMEWINSTQNDINFTLTLVSNDVKYNLFKNPVINIKLPKDVDKVILGDTALLYDDNMKIENTEIIDNGENKEIKITLSGIQNSYITSDLYDGPCIIVPATLILKNDIVSDYTDVEITYTNESGIINDYELEGKTNKNLTIKQLDMNSISNFNIEENTQKLNSPAIGEQDDQEEITEGLDIQVYAQVGNKVLKEDDIVYEKQIITYKVKISNNTENNLEKIKAIAVIPEGTTFVTVQKGQNDDENIEKIYEYIKDDSISETTIEIEKISSGETVEKYFEVEVDELQENVEELKIQSIIKVFRNNIKLKEVTLNNLVKKHQIYTRLVSSLGGSQEEDNIWQYYLIVDNSTEQTINNLDISVNIPEVMKVFETGIISSDKDLKNELIENNRLKMEVAEVQAREKLIIKIYMKPEKLLNNVYEYDLEVAAEIALEDIGIYNTNINRQKMYTREITVSMTSESEGEKVRYNEKINYEVILKNNGRSVKNEYINVNVLDYLPEELKPVEVQYENFIFNEETNEYNKELLTKDISSKEVIGDVDENNVPDVNLSLMILNGASIRIMITATADLLDEETEIANSVSIAATGFDTVISNTVKTTILPYEEESAGGDNNGDNNGGDNNNAGTENEDKNYLISGEVWLDKNKNGKKDDTEQRLSDITVKLFDEANNSIVTNEKGEKYIVKTSLDGKYEFSNLDKGKYLVLFEYDTENYYLTDYQKSGISEDSNSDVINKQVSIDGVEKKVGITNTIYLTSSNKENIDMGIIQNKKYDLSLKKYIEKVTVKNSSGSKDYQYNNTDLAKIEIPSKQVDSTEISIEYKIIVTNEGNVPAYVSEITDYLPKTLELQYVDGNWSKTNTGDVVITALSGILLKPGETKVITLIANAKNMGTIVNSAEITLSKNADNLTDLDSIENNKNTKEDDYSEATVIISIKTGTLLRIGLILTLVIVLVLLFLGLTKNKQWLKKVFKLYLLVLIAFIVVGINFSEGYTDAELKKLIQKKYTTTQKISINSGSSNFATHSTPYSGYVNTGKIHCTDNAGIYSMCGAGTHKYEQQSVSVSILKNTKTEITTPNEYDKKIDNAKFNKLNDNYNILGPYTITRTNKDKLSEDSISFKVYANSSTVLSDSEWDICNSSGTSKKFSYNSEFYIKVSSKYNKISKIVATVKNTYDVKYEVKYKVIEKWKCTSVSGSHNGHGCSNPAKVQPGERVFEDIYKETDTVTKSKSFTLKGGSSEKDPPSSTLSLKKVDDRDNNVALENVGFTFVATVQTYDYKYSVEHWKWVSCTHWISSGYWSSYTDSEGNITWYWVDTSHYAHSQDYVYDWTQNFYEWTDHTMYLGSNGMWGGPMGTFYTDSEGIVSATGSFPQSTIVNESYDGQSYISYGRFKDGSVITGIEVSNPYYGYAENLGKTYSIPVNGSTAIIAENHQKLVKLSGYVWLDGEEGKTSLRNDEFDSDEPGMNGIIVYLKNSNGSVVKTAVTSELGIYSEINGGEYQFVDVDLDQLEAGQYYIEFEYCGITYHSVASNIHQQNCSKVDETNSREILDNKFTSVNGNGSQILNVNGVTINYNNTSGHSSTVNSHTGCNVYANTNMASYGLYDDFEPSLEEIKYINLGLYEKAQTDYALVQDLYNVRVDVNGFSHVYRYATARYNYDGSVNEDSSWNVGVKFQKNTGTYSRAIYNSDVEYEAKNHRDNEIRVYVTYKIALKNESTYLGRINSIVDYCDNRYTLVNAGTTIDNSDNITGNINFGQKIAYDGEYSKYIIDVNSLIDPGETNFIYVQFEIRREGILAILNGGELLNNVAEVNSYTTFQDYNINSPVAVIDTDSVPGNARPGQVPTYEDDTDAARSLQLELKNERALVGTVFVDSTNKDSNTLYTNEERKGNGIFDEGEKTLEGIKVRLRETGKDDSSYDDERVEMETTTDEKGDFKFVGYIPGNYILTYTWGNKEYKVQYYKGTIYDETRNQNDTYWYRDDNVDIRKTDALDSSSIRTQIDNEMENLKYNTLESEIEKAYNGESDYIKTTTMNSSTPVMSFSVEYLTTVTDGTEDQVVFTVKNIDFGIVERPKQQLDFSKRISAYKLTLANGQVLVDATISEDGKVEGTYSSSIYMGPTTVDFSGLVKTEIDNELIEGATVEITYTMKVINISELDYVSSRYYYYGNSIDSDKVKVSVTDLLDYVDGNLVVLDNKWEEKDITYLNKVNASQKNNKDYLNLIRSYSTTYLSKELVPTESHTVSLYTSKLLTSTHNNTFNNKSEIVEVTKTDAFNTGTPVKVNWEGKQSYFNSDNAETVIIIPSTGEDRAYSLYIILGITTLVILSAGIVIIKKKVLD